MLAKKSDYSLDRGNPIPLYEQLQERILAELRDARGAVDLSDAALTQRYGLSRMTVRAAVSELVRRGVLTRVPGRGTFPVKHPSIALELGDLRRFFAEWHLSGLDPGTRVLSFETVAASADVAHRLDLMAGDEVLMLRRLRCAQGEPMTYDERYVAGWCAGNITRSDAEQEMLFDILFLKDNIVTASVDQEVGAVAADAEIASILNVPAASPLLKRTVTFFSADNRPTITGTGWYRSDRFRFKMHAER